ncbi:unnamed protein product, partial [Rotaria sp. Silwood2]
TTTVTSTTTTVAIKQAYYCGNISSFTLWQLFPNDGIYMNIDTTNCSFTSTPVYFTSMAGDTVHWELVSYNAIYVPTKNSFTIYVRALNGWNSTDMFTNSQLYRWNVNWFGITR